VRDFLKEYPDAFSPEAVLILVDVFEDAWKAVEGSERTDDETRELAREALARRIIAVVQAGETDRQRLYAVAPATFKLRHEPRATVSHRSTFRGALIMRGGRSP
jgi:hypothetical protein